MTLQQLPGELRMPAQFSLEIGPQFHLATTPLVLITYFQLVVALATLQAYRCNHFYEAFTMLNMMREPCGKLLKL
jgi:hypothetical protein